MKEKWASIRIITAAFAIAGVLATEPALAKDECGSTAIQKAVKKNAYTVVVDKFKFPVPIGLRTSIDRCRYYTEEDFNLVTARVTWNGPLKGVLYDTTLFFIIEDAQWDYKLLGANDDARDYMFSVNTWFPALTGTGKARRNFGSPTQGPFN